MTRRKAILLLPASQIRAVDPCEQEAMDKWNRFAETSTRYHQQKQAGVVDVKLRARMIEQGLAALRCECI